jgi:hypothetical protein
LVPQLCVYCSGKFLAGAQVTLVDHTLATCFAGCMPTSGRARSRFDQLI